MVAAGMAGSAAYGLDPVQASLAVEPSVAQVGMTVNVTLTVTNVGGLPFTDVNPFISVTAGATLVTLTSNPWLSASQYLPPGGSIRFTWTFSVSATGTVNLTAWASGYINNQPVSYASTAILVIPGPTSPTIRILNNAMRDSRPATVVLHGTPGKAVTLLLYDQAGRPLGPIGLGTVTLDAAGNGSARFDGRVQGTRLTTGVYWIVATGGASAKAPVLFAP
jgi:hypothetical protein